MKDNRAELTKIRCSHLRIQNSVLNFRGFIDFQRQMSRDQKHVNVRYISCVGQRSPGPMSYHPRESSVRRGDWLHSTNLKRCPPLLR